MKVFTEYKVYSVVAVISAVLILLAVYVGDYEGGVVEALGDKKVISSFLKELGFAGVIALIVIFTVESFSKARHMKHSNEFVENLIKKMNKGMFAAMYNKNLPESIFSEVEDVVLRTSVYRKNHKVDYVLSPLCGTHSLKATVESTYTLCNASNCSIEHEFVIALEKPLDAQYNELCCVNVLRIGKIIFSDTEINDNMIETDEQFLFGTSIPLSAEEEIDISMKTTLVKLSTDTEILTSRVPSTGIDVSVRVPEDDFSVLADAMHPESIELVVDHGGLRRWSLNRAILPYQSVVFWWSRSE